MPSRLYARFASRIVHQSHLHCLRFKLSFSQTSNSLILIAKKVACTPNPASDHSDGKKGSSAESVGGVAMKPRQTSARARQKGAAPTALAIASTPSNASINAPVPFSSFFFLFLPRPLFFLESVVRQHPRIAALTSLERNRTVIRPAE